VNASGGRSTSKRSRAGVADPRQRPAEPVGSADDEQLNDDIHALLRDAAEEREGRARTEASENDAAARRQFDSVVDLARARSRSTRR